MSPPSTGRLAFFLLFAALVLVRVPSLAQPAGADQGLYAYVGQTILRGGLPYRDAWDQKPPAIHATYAAMFAAWADQRVVAATDLVVATLTALLLVVLGRHLVSSAAVGKVAALLFLLLANPAFSRLGGVRLRAQCEVFIALVVCAAFVLLGRAMPRRDLGASESGAGVDASARARFPLAAALGAGLLVGIAAAYKYNAVVYFVPLWLLLVLRRGTRSDWVIPRLRAALAIAAGGAAPMLVILTVFAAGGALADLYAATVTYNLRYSGETYGGLAAFARYLFTFPVQYARVDSLWWIGGLGCVTLLAAGLRRPGLLVVPAWVAASCVSIAVNSGRGLPQYFVQAGPPLALASAYLVTALWQRVGVIGRAAFVALLATGIWRVTNVAKGIDNTAFDLAALTGRLDSDTYLARFGDPAGDQKYSALAVHRLARTVREQSGPGETVLVFGFSQGALVESGRRSASRFFWSRPIIVGFNAGVPGYGVAGMLQELERSKPRLVALQRSDWQLEGTDSASFFMGQPALVQWLEQSYSPAGTQDNFVLWRRRVP